MVSVLIVGGGGYIGTVLVDILLKKNFKVEVFDRFSGGLYPINSYLSNKNFFYTAADILERNALRASVSRCDFIVWLAAVVSPAKCASVGEKIVHEVNVKSLDFLHSYREDKPLIFLSTNIGYGAKNKSLLYTEESPMEPNSLYGKSKIMAENLLTQTNNFAILRPASSFGVSSRMKDHLLLHYYIREAVQSGYIELYEGSNMRNFIHVKDLSKCILMLIDKFSDLKNQIYNVGNSQANIKKIDLIKMIKKKHPSLEFITIDGSQDPDNRDYIVSNAKIEAAGFLCDFSLEDGLVELFNYYKAKK